MRFTTLLISSACTAIALVLAILFLDGRSDGQVAGNAVPEEESAELVALTPAQTDEGTIAAIEMEGAGFPRDASYNDYPPYPLDESLTLIGRSERVCVSVPSELGHIVQSGEFVIGGIFFDLRHGRSMKIWWHPLNSTMDMTLLVRGLRLGSEPASMRFESDEVSAPLHSDTHEPYADEASFPTGTLFPAAGRWVVVATSARNWGCFVFDVA